MKKLYFSGAILLSAWLAFMTGCSESSVRMDGGGAAPAADGSSASATGVIGYEALYNQYVLKAGGCGVQGCHSGEGVAGLSFDNLEKSYQRLILGDVRHPQAAADGLKLVTPRDPEKSLLYWKLATSTQDLVEKGYGSPMPFGSLPKPGPKLREAIVKWIEAGAPLKGDAIHFDIEQDKLSAGKGNEYINCTATDEEGLRKCFPEKSHPQALRIFTKPMKIPPKSDVTICAYIPDRLADDLYVQDIRGYQMRGGHHTAAFLALVPSDDPTPVLCKDDQMPNIRFVMASFGDAGNTGLAAGHAVKVDKGSQFLIQAHYINVQDKEVTVMDAIDLIPSDKGAQSVMADAFAMLNGDFKIPSGADSHRVETTCELDTDMNIHIMLGHMHEYARLFSYSRIPAGGGTPELLYQGTDGRLLRNSPDIKAHGDKPLQWKKGDKVQITCVWKNPTDHELIWPEEMCVGLVYYSPGRGFLKCEPGDGKPKVIGQDNGGGFCPPEGTPGNSLGVGKSCKKGGKECEGNGKATLCLATFDARARFCSLFGCKQDSDCGENAFCEKQSAGSACVPNLCK
ncbi:MAG: hypothetical protein GMKNLPBB_00986 [Myxococcota bacterium]|nr:hypothetical protein [Myxococcota bacterium]